MLEWYHMVLPEIDGLIVDNPYFDTLNPEGHFYPTTWNSLEIAFGEPMAKEKPDLDQRLATLRRWLAAQWDYDPDTLTYRLITQ